MAPSDRSSSKPRVAVIGGGLFGVTAALSLARFCDVELFERGTGLFQGATFANHNRQHFGFHYPRSPETALQCLNSRDEFRTFYGDAEIFDFTNYYCVASNGSKVTPSEYIHFCDKAGLQYELEFPSKNILDINKIALSVRVNEGVCDLAAMKRIAHILLSKESTIKIFTKKMVVGGRILSDKTQQLIIAEQAGSTAEAFDFIVNATYAHYNSFCEWFGFPSRNFQFNLQELNIIELPSDARIGVTIMDGSFPSMIPMGGTPYHLLAHVDKSQLIRESSNQSKPLLERSSAIESNWTEILEASVVYLPILKKARYIKSLFVDRVVDAGASKTDARLTDITDHGSNCFSIFSAKVITCVSTANKLAEIISSRL